MKKNDTCTIRIDDINSDGNGIGRADGYVLFVKDAVPGDVCRVRVTKTKKSFGYARLLDIISPSPDRVPARCPVARACGGCRLQEISYERQLAFKEEKVKNDFLRIGGIDPEKVRPVTGMENPFRYRNKAQIPVGLDGDGNIIAGFYASRTHSIIRNDDCLLGPPENRRITEIVIDHMNKNGIMPYDEKSGGGLVRHILIRKAFSTGAIMVCVIINGESLPGAEALAEGLFEIPGMSTVSININTQRNNVILGERTINVRGDGVITDMIGDIRFEISPRSFYQVNSEGTKKLYETAREYAKLSGNEIVWDLYCGIGTISLFVAGGAREVYGIECVPDAVEDAKKNARLNGVSNVRFICADAEKIGPGQLPRPDVVIVDPPRKGCGESLLDVIAQAGPERIVYVSCDPATLSRDLSILCRSGYEVVEAQPVDMFPQTVHVETVVLMSIKDRNPDTHINVSLDMDDYHRIIKDEAFVKHTEEN